MAPTPVGSDPVEDDPHGLRNPEPHLPGQKRSRQIRRTDAGGEGPHGTAGDGVAVGAHHQVARADPIRLQRHLKADAATHRKEIHPVIGREGLHAGVEAKGRGGGGGGIVVPGQEHPFGTTAPLATHGLEVVDGHGGGPIGTQDKVGLADNDVPGAGVGPGVGREDLLRQRAGGHQIPSRTSRVRSTSDMRMSPI